MSKHLRKTLLASMFLSIGIVLPFFTSQIKEIGDTLLPMHLPVMLSGALLGPYYGLAVGFLTPLLRGLMFTMPPLYPNAIWMATELATYGFILGLIYFKSKNKNVGRLYISLAVSMLGGRIVWGITKALLLGVAGKGFTLLAFVTGGFLDSIPGIIIQFILIPIIVKLIEKRLP